MESQPNSHLFGEWARSVDPVIWPAIAAIVVGGVLLLCTLIGMFWLASRSTNQQPIVIWMPASATQPADKEQFATAHSTVSKERHSDARAN